MEKTDHTVLGHIAGLDDPGWLDHGERLGVEV
jgi:hypothetical protein